MRLLFLMLVFWPSNGCKDNPVVSSDLDKLVYEISSRGYFRHIEISEEHIMVSKNRAMDKVLSKEISLENWQSMVQMVQNLDMEKLSSINTSTEESALDRSPIGELTVYVDENSYTSPMFDHSNPPLILKPLITEIVALAETVE